MADKYSNIETLYEVQGTRLVKSEFILQLAKAGKPLPRCQDLPLGSYLLPADLRKDPKRGIVALSYSWINGEHPDPKGHQLKTVAEFLRIPLEPFDWATRTYPTFTTFAVFWDWASLPQNPRTSEQDRADFAKGLRDVNLWYAHRHSFVVLLTKFPKSAPLDVRPYSSRGWPMFERAVASLCTPSDRLFDLGCLRNCQDFVELRRKCSRGVREAPLMPDVFEERMRRRDDSGNFELHFTEGKSDRDFVIDKYAATAKEVMRSVEELDYDCLDWDDGQLRVFVDCLPLAAERLRVLYLNQNGITDAGAACLAEALPQFRLLTRLVLDTNRIADAGADALAQALAHLPELTELNLSYNAIQDAGAEQLAQAAQKLRWKVVSLNSNIIGDGGAVRWAQAIPLMPGLETLKLNKNCMGPAGKEALLLAWELAGKDEFKLDLDFQDSKERRVEEQDRVNQAFDQRRTKAEEYKETRSHMEEKTATSWVCAVQ